MEAEMVQRMCEQYQALPDAGGVLDQDISVLRMRAILVEGGYFDEQGVAAAGVPVRAADPLAGIEMVTLG